MSQPKQSLIDMLRTGNLVLPPEPQGVDPTAQLKEFQETIHFMEETNAEALAAPRKPGRPGKMATRRQTEVRGLRLEMALWANLEILADRQGCSINRYIEESILERIGVCARTPHPVGDNLDIPSSTTYKAIQPYEVPSMPYRNNILTFQRGAA